MACSDNIKVLRTNVVAPAPGKLAKRLLLTPWSGEFALAALKHRGGAIVNKGL